MVRPKNLKLFFLAPLFLVACSGSSPDKKFALAEKFWVDGNYKAAVTEFQKIYRRDPKGKLGRKALLRAAMTQTHFLKQHNEAADNLKEYLSLGGEPELQWQARRELGEILFEKQGRYREAAQYYQELLALNPTHDDAAEFLYRIGRCQFFLWKFDQAIQSYQEIFQKYRDSQYAEKALYEIGVTHFTAAGEADGKAELYEKAIKAYERFLETFPNSELGAQAKFGIASSLIELDRPDAAREKLEELKDIYPNKSVIELKLHRLKDRQK